jgi:hypothetical protein
LERTQDFDPISAPQYLGPAHDPVENGALERPATNVRKALQQS